MEKRKENEGEKGRKRGWRRKYDATTIMEEKKIKKKGVNRGLGFNKINEMFRSILMPRFILWVLGLGLSFLSP